MKKHASGYDYVPDGGGEKVCRQGDFIFASAGLSHGHILAQTTGLINAGGVCKYVWDESPEKIADFKKRFPDAIVADSLEQILNDKDVRLIANASIASERAGVGFKALGAGKHFFVDKPPFTTVENLEIARKKVKETGLKFMPYYAERIHNQAAIMAGKLIKEGAIGRVLQVLIMAPHRISKTARPDWFFDREKYGGILTDIGSHQFEQFLEFTGANDATINFARVDNFANKDKPGLQDFGEASLTMNNGASCYCRVDWFTPNALPVWGDGRTFVLGTDGYIEVRKYIDYSQNDNPSQILYITTHDKPTQMIDCRQESFPFFGKFILDILNGTENAMTQEHAFKAAELALRAQELAEKNRHG